MRSRIASTPLFDAASSSTRSKNVPAAIASQFSHTPHGSPSAPRFEAVQRAGEQAGGRGLARAARAGEQVGVADPVLAYRVAQRGRDVILADELREMLGPVLAVEAVRRHAGHTTDARVR